MRRLALLLLLIALCSGRVLAGAQGEGASPAPEPQQKSVPAEGAAPQSEVPGNAAAIAKAEAQGTRIGDFTLFCPQSKDKDSAKPCSLEQLVIDADSKKVAFHLVVSYGPRGNLVLIIRTPLGLDLVRGIEFSFGSLPVQRTPFTTCEPNGCRGVLILSPPLQEEMRKADRALITVYALDGKPFQAATSLKGFGNGADQLAKRRGPS